MRVERSFRSKTFSPCLLIAVVLIGGAGADKALGQPPARELPAQHKRAAHAAYERGDYRRAIAEFQRAHELRHDSRLLYNIALAYYKQFHVGHRFSDLTQARDLFRRFLLLVDPDDPRHRSDRARLMQAQDLTRHYLKRIRQLQLRQLRARDPHATPGHGSQEAPGPATAAEEGQDDQRAGGSGAGPHGRYVPWFLFAGAAAMAIAATATGVTALSRESEAEQLVEVGDARGAMARADSADAYALATDILLVGSAASALVGLVVLLKTRSGPGPDPRANRVRIDARPSAVGLTVSF